MDSKQNFETAFPICSLESENCTSFFQQAVYRKKKLRNIRVIFTWIIKTILKLCIIEGIIVNCDSLVICSATWFSTCYFYQSNSKDHNCSKWTSCWFVSATIWIQSMQCETIITHIMHPVSMKLLRNLVTTRRAPVSVQVGTMCLGLSRIRQFLLSMPSAATIPAYGWPKGRQSSKWD